jgi:signal transduction histidine kinase
MDAAHAASPSVPWETVLSYEARLNEWFSKRPFVGLCRYHRSSFSPAVIHDMLRTHPVAIVSQKLCRNPYFEKPDVALAPNGEAARVEWMLRQLRWSRLAEMRLREMTRSLADQAARLAADNQSHHHDDQQQERAIRMRDRMLAILAKELAAPIAGLSDELRAEPGAADDRDGRRAGARGSAVFRHLRRLGALVEELRHVSRLTNRQTPVDLDDLDLVDVARQVLLRHRDHLATAGCTLTFHAEPRIQGRWDRRRVEQVLVNLVGNAIRHGAGRPIEIDLSSDADSARARVSFSGVPLSPDDDEERLFEEVEIALGSDVSRSPLGMLGLWGARDVAGALGGAIHVAEAAPGADGTVATTVTLDLPRSPRRADADRHRDVS